MASQIQHQEGQLATAIGTGIGVPLGLASAAFLGFLIWRGRRLRGAKTTARLGTEFDSHNTSAIPEHHNGGRRELADSQIPSELDFGNGKVELLNIRPQVRS